MALLGNAALAMWWDITPDWRREFEDWHSHEHFPERTGIPGFLRSSRWASAEGGEGFFVMYELDDHATLTSPRYLERLNHPTPWSTRVMPHHRNMVRSQCRVLDSAGGGIAGYALTLRLSPADGMGERLREYLRAQAQGIANRRGTTGAHLLQTETPPLAATVEQKIRGGADRVADWIFVVCGYEPAALEGLQASELSAAQLSQQGAAPQVLAGLYRLSHTSMASDFG